MVYLHLHCTILLLINNANFISKKSIFFGLGDGDSSVTKKLNEALPYGPDFKIQKIECRNHLLRNYGMKLSAISKKTEYPVTIRKFISSNIIRFRTDITKAIQHHINKNSSLPEKIRG